MIHIELLRYLPILGFAVIMTWILFKKWDFISKALSDNNLPSATRLNGTLLIVTACFCEIYSTIRGKHFEKEHLYAFLIGAGVFFGYIKVMDALSIYKNKPTEPQKEDKKDEPVKTETKIDALITETKS